MRKWAALLALLAACNVPAAEEGARPGLSDDSALSLLPPGVTEEVVEDALRRLPEDLSDIDIAAVEVILFEDTSLGCPEPGVEYNSADIEGFEIVVETSAGHLVYKVNDVGEFILCVADSSEVVIEMMSGSDNSPHPSSDGTVTAISPESDLPDSLAAAIREDAATVAGVDPSSVTLGETTNELFNDGSLGCPKKGYSYIQVLTPGWIVMVSAGPMNLEYHAAASGYFVICP